MITSKFIAAVSVMAFLFCSCGSNDEHKPPVVNETNPVTSLKNALKEFPDSLSLAEELIEAYRNAGNYDSALAVTNQQIKKDSGNAYMWNIKATLYFESEDTAKAIQSLEQAIAIYPLPEYLVALGTIFAETKSRNALQIADELLRSNKTKSAKDAWFIKGMYYNYINEPHKAIPYLDSCLKADYTYMYAYREKAIALYNIKNYNDAIKVLQRAVTLQNNYDEGYYWLGKCYEKLDDPEAAIESYQSALLYDKDYTEAKEALSRLQKK
jgi:tetratricopeptide (TPR) repeat protein